MLMSSENGFPSFFIEINHFQPVLRMWIENFEAQFTIGFLQHILKESASHPTLIAGLQVWVCLG